MNKKYELIASNSIGLYRIRAIRDFGGVSAGDLGGFVSSEANLSHDGECWIYDNAQVYGEAQVFDDAKVCHNARVYGHAQVFDHAQVFGEAQVFDDAKVFGKACVYGNVHVCDNAMVCSDALVFNVKEEARNDKADAARLLYDTLLTALYEMCRGCPKWNDVTCQCIGDGKCFVKAWWKTLDKTKGIAK